MDARGGARRPHRDLFNFREFRHGRQSYSSVRGGASASVPDMHRSAALPPSFRDRNARRNPLSVSHAADLKSTMTTGRSNARRGAFARPMRYFRQTAILLAFAALAPLTHACAPTSGATAYESRYGAPRTASVQAQPPATDVMPPLPTEPAAQARALTSYLKSHRLPLVAANVVGGAGQTEVILYGFVATPVGKSNAESRTRRFFRNADIQISNRIIIEPQLLAAKTGAPAPSAAPATTPDAGNEAFDQLSAYQSYQSQDLAAYERQQRLTQPRPASWADIFVSLLMMAPMFIP